MLSYVTPILLLAQAATPYQPAHTVTPLPVGLPSMNVSLPVGGKAAVQDLVIALTNSEVWAELDPTWKLAHSPRTRTFRFGPRYVVRLSPNLLAGGDLVPVEGADRVVTLYEGEIVDIRIGGPLTPAASPFFKVGAETAAHIARSVVPGALTNPAGDPAYLAKKVFVSLDDGVRPAWRVRLLTWNILDLRDVWVDAETGAVLRSQKVAREQVPTAAKVYDTSPIATPADPTELVLRQLADLFDDGSTGVGERLLGYHFETANCCKRYTCATLADIDCEISDPGVASDPPSQIPYQNSMADRVCAADNDMSAFEARVLVRLPSEMLGLPAGGTLFLNSVFCTEKPRVVSKSGAGPSIEDGWFETPVDGPDINAETDAFAEIQTYYATHKFFEHLRTVFGNPAFCLDDPAMSCDGNGDAVLLSTGLPARPFHITTNLVIPTIDMDDIIYQATPVFLNGLGRGVSSGNPVLIDTFQRTGNAAFVPAMRPDAVGIPPELAPIATIFARPFDSNIYFQGDLDFGYDGDVVFHEFTHATVHTLNSGLWSMGRDRWGSNAEPGALNEGWADYFAASFTNDSLTGEYAGAYGGGGIRDANNTDTCPESLIGEVHQDSLPWSGALWDLRAAVMASDPGLVDALDALLLANIVGAAPNASMNTRAEAIIASLTGDAQLSAFATDATNAFNGHNILGCQRAVPLSTWDGSSHTYTPWPQLFQPARNEIGTGNIAPSVLQFTVDLPAASPGFTLSWNQAGGGMLGTGQQPVLSVVGTSNGPIVWSYVLSTQVARPSDSNGVIIFDPVDSAFMATNGTPNANGVLTATYDYVPPADCNDRTFHISLVSLDAGASLSSIAVSVDSVDISACPGTGGSGGSAGSGGAAGTGGSGAGGSGTGTAGTGGSGGGTNGGGGCSCDAASVAPFGMPVGVVIIARLRRRRRKGRRYNQC